MKNIIQQKDIIALKDITQELIDANLPNSKGFVRAMTCEEMIEIHKIPEFGPVRYVEPLA